MNLLKGAWDDGFTWFGNFTILVHLFIAWPCNEMADVEGWVMPRPANQLRVNSKTPRWWVIPHFGVLGDHIRPPILILEAFERAWLVVLTAWVDAMDGGKGEWFHSDGYDGRSKEREQLEYDGESKDVERYVVRCRARRVHRMIWRRTFSKMQAEMQWKQDMKSFSPTVENPFAWL